MVLGVSLLGLSSAAKCHASRVHCQVAICIALPFGVSFFMSTDYANTMNWLKFVSLVNMTTGLV